jgi:hypothetical protein
MFFIQIILWLTPLNKLLINLIPKKRFCTLYKLQTILYFCFVKKFCLMLSVYVMLISAKPCCMDDDCQDKISVKKELAGQTTSRQKECPGCSPFFTCGSCVGFIVSKPFAIALPVIPEDQIEYYPNYQQPYVEKVALSIWLLPKIS